MDAFEDLVASLLEREGYWVRSRFKVNLTREDKQRIGRPSAPRWELDIVAYRGETNELLAVECKSFLDSRGVVFHDLARPDPKAVNRYKLFNDEVLRQVVLDRLKAQLVQALSCKPEPSIQLCLAAGAIATDADHQQLKQHFDQNGWMLLDRNWLCRALKNAASSGFEDHAAFIVAKLLLRESRGEHGRRGGAKSQPVLPA